MGQVRVFEAAGSGRLAFEFPFARYGRLISNLSKAFPDEVYAIGENQADAHRIDTSMPASRHRLAGYDRPVDQAVHRRLQ